jgi:hypothetical protein
MTIWVDAHLSPRIARWISANFPVTAQPLREIELRDADDDDIFTAARTAGVIVLTKDSDFMTCPEGPSRCVSEEILVDWTEVERLARGREYDDFTEVRKLINETATTLGQRSPIDSHE